MKYPQVVYVAAFLAGLSACGVIACGPSEPASPSFEIQLSAVTDEGAYLGQVDFLSQEKSLGRTGKSGSFSVKLRAPEGTALPVVASCPDGFVSPEPTSLRLTKVKSLEGGKSKPISFEATCTRKVRDLVVVVHAENGAGLPVVVDGEPLGTTDELGNAHVLVQRDREVKSLAVSLDTSEKVRLRPQNPSRIVDLKGHDGVVLFHQVLAQARPTRVVSQKPRRHVPYRVK